VTECPSRLLWFLAGIVAAPAATYAGLCVLGFWLLTFGEPAAELKHHQSERERE
jgi:hypothetical protein